MSRGVIVNNLSSGFFNGKGSKRILFNLLKKIFGIHLREI